MRTKLVALSIITLSFLGTNSFAAGSKKASNDESVMDRAVEKTKELGNDTARAVKKTSRDIEDKACEMINGKMECAAQKVENAAKNAADKVEDAVE